MTKRGSSAGTGRLLTLRGPARRLRNALRTRKRGMRAARPESLDTSIAPNKGISRS